ncbi:tetratricopeptide repeat protein [Sulfurovum sp. ST-21]
MMHIKRSLLPALLVLLSGLVHADDLAIQNRNNIIALQRVVMEQNERIDGLTSLIEGLSASVAELKMAKRKGISSAEENNITLKLIRDLGKMIDEINRSYVSKTELKRILDGEKAALSKEKKKSVKKQQRAENELERTAPAKLYSEGVRLFVKKRYEEAAKRFILTSSKGYKPAASNYYLGEIAYYTRKYQDAIFYYKKSASLYDRASYMDVLLLHTAVSLDKTGEKEQAKVFYNNVIDNYPDKKSSAIAKEKLKRI